jgi:hypothetical protein
MVWSFLEGELFAHCVQQLTATKPSASRGERIVTVHLRTNASSVVSAARRHKTMTKSSFQTGLVFHA